jgi:protein-tyrosine kinase
MSSLIEQAAKRLEQLRQAGVEIPEPDPGCAAPLPQGRPSQAAGPGR